MCGVPPTPRPSASSAGSHAMRAGVRASRRDSAKAMTEEQFHELRRSAFAIAYRMLGSVSEAEDVVQEGLLRLHRARGRRADRVAAAYLSTVVSRLSLDPLPLGSGPARDLRGRVAAEAARGERRRRSRPQGRDGGLAVARLPRPAREPVARAARRLPAARGVRRALRPDRGDRRDECVERPPARHTRPPPRGGAAPPVRGLAEGQIQGVSAIVNLTSCGTGGPWPTCARCCATTASVLMR